MTTRKNADAGLTYYPWHSSIPSFTYSSQDLLVSFLITCLISYRRISMRWWADDRVGACLRDGETSSQCRKTELGSSTELSCTFVSYVAPFWAELYPTELRCTLLSNAVFFWAKLHRNMLRCTLWASLYTLWAMLHPTEPSCTLMSYAAPSWAMLHHPELRHIPRNHIVDVLHHLQQDPWPSLFPWCDVVPFFDDLWQPPGFRICLRALRTLRMLRALRRPRTLRTLRAKGIYMFKGTVSWDRFQKFWLKFTELDLTKGRGWFLNYLWAPMIL
jgi:hypothetical protein